MNSYEIKQRLIKIYSQPDYYTNRRKANNKYYSKQTNIEAKREYMREYAKRDYVKARQKKYLKKYNLRPLIKVKRHEWYINKKIKEYEKEKNENLHAQNAERFTDV